MFTNSDLFHTVWEEFWRRTSVNLKEEKSIGEKVDVLKGWKLVIEFVDDGKDYLRMLAEYMNAEVLEKKVDGCILIGKNGIHWDWLFECFLYEKMLSIYPYRYSVYKRLFQGFIFYAEGFPEKENIKFEALLQMFGGRKTNCFPLATHVISWERVDCEDSSVPTFHYSWINDCIRNDGIKTIQESIPLSFGDFSTNVFQTPDMLSKTRRESADVISNGRKRKGNCDEKMSPPTKRKKSSVFILLSIDYFQNEQLVTAIEELGGRYTFEWSDEVTHVIYPTLRRSEKILLALACGKWILRPEYILESFRKAEWLPCEKFEFQGKFPKMSASPNAYWRKKVSLKKTPFRESSFVIDNSCQRKSIVSLLIDLGGGILWNCSDITPDEFERKLQTADDFYYLCCPSEFSPSFAWFNVLKKYQSDIAILDELFIIEYLCYAGKVEKDFTIQLKDITVSL